MSPELLLEWLGITEPPLNARAMAEALDIVVSDEELGRYTYVLAVNERQAGILLSSRATPSQRHLAIARAMGHLVLHEGVEFRELETSSAEPSEEEVEADLYAARLLMPAAWLGPRLRRGESLEALALAFGVSERRMATRIRVLQPSIAAPDPTFD